MTITYESTRRQIQLEHGCVHYHDVGEGPVLLLIHGSGPGVSGWANFQGNLPVFSRHFRCIVPDLPGYGHSDPLAADPVTGCVTVCMGLLQALGITKVHIIGNSLGGIVGSHIAASYPDAVATFTTIGGIGLNVFTTFPGEGLNLLTAFTEDPTRERLAGWLCSMVYDQTIVTDELIDLRYRQAIEPKTLETSRKLYSRQGIQAITQARRQYGAKVIEHLSAIKAPTLITWGRDDRVSPLDICLLPMRLIENCELHVFPNCGHWAMIECKERFETLVMDFINSNEQR